MVAWIIRHAFRFGRARRGGISIEFAILASIVVTMLFSGVEFGRYVLMSTKFDRAVTTIGDMFTQNTSVTATDAIEIFSAGQKVVKPYSLAGNGIVIVTHVKAKSKNDPRVTWQLKGVGTAALPSPIGLLGGKAKLPADMTLAQDEVVVVVELMYKYTPILFNLVAGDSEIYRVSYHRPRVSDEISYLP